MTNFLLLLSAMLSALVGAGPGARVADAPAAAMAGSVVSENASAMPSRVVAMRPVQSPAALVAMLAIGGLVMLFVAPARPAWADRRRE